MNRPKQRREPTVMLKPIKLSKAVKDLQLPLNYLIDCMIDADRDVRIDGSFNFYSYTRFGTTICIAVMRDEILAVRGEEAATAAWLGLSWRDKIGWANLEKLRGYLHPRPQPEESS